MGKIEDEAAHRERRLQEAGAATGVIIKPQTLRADHACIRLLETVIEDARRGGVSSVVLVTVSPDGTVQCPGEGGQLREILAGLDTLRGRLSRDYGVGVDAIGQYKLHNS